VQRGDVRAAVQAAVLSQVLVDVPERAVAAVPERAVADRIDATKRMSAHSAYRMRYAMEPCCICGNPQRKLALDITLSKQAHYFIGSGRAVRRAGRTEPIEDLL